MLFESVRAPHILLQKGRGRGGGTVDYDTLPWQNRYHKAQNTFF